MENTSQLNTQTAGNGNDQQTAQQYAQELANQQEYLDAKHKLSHTLAYMIPGFIVGMIAGAGGFSLFGEGTAAIIGMGFVGAFALCTWCLLPILVVGWVAIVLKLIAAIVLGMILGPILLIYNIARLVYWRHKISKPAQKGGV